MFFFHPDHLGSITMITDGAGNPASGPEPGTSFVSYEPYGSIIRNDSYGPDIFRYKFTGQIEDKETGLYYYKARYYEPTLGRFLQADSVIDSDAPNGQNRYMYVEGNPVNYRDPSGHVSGAGLMHMMNRMIGHAMGKDFHNGNSPSMKSIGKDLSKSNIVKKINNKDIQNGIDKEYKKFIKWTQKATFITYWGGGLARKERHAKQRKTLGQLFRFVTNLPAESEKNKEGPTNDDPICKEVGGVIQCGECIVFPTEDCPLPESDEPEALTLEEDRTEESERNKFLTEKIF
ncbi:RHS repeat domain-containing protein [Leptospira sp. Fiocruz LV4135]|uniref:RHS repeat domain-containing protein n=1 Tax=Leptospira sp. Fiocruz LV4135 TaxID=1193013 RepID=UPI0002BF5421|nr:RHS repeat-associated core domain-containing protein [Leptospira sp. Fiocruz LV4135]EMI62835.1 RHS repeat-associated core domain protein [Leptospira sp. Fiocruz LV4135]